MDFKTIELAQKIKDKGNTLKKNGYVNSFNVHIHSEVVLTSDEHGEIHDTRTFINVNYTTKAQQQYASILPIPANKRMLQIFLYGMEEYFKSL